MRENLPSFVHVVRESSWGFSTGSGVRRRVLTTPNMAAFPPIPMARESTATVVNPGLFLRTLMT